MNRKEFTEKYSQIVRLAAQFNEIARREGLLSLEDKLEDMPAEGDRDIFKYGIRFAVDGTNPAYIDRVLTNIINQEKDEEKRVLKTIQKEAALLIQEGCNVNLMFAMLNSYTDISLAENEAILNTVDYSSFNKEEEAPDETDTGKLQIFAAMTDRDIQMVMRSLDSLALAKALKGEGKKVRDAFFRNMSERAAAMLKEDMQYMGPIRVEDMEEAQESILAVLLRLNDTGEILIAEEETHPANGKKTEVLSEDEINNLLSEITKSEE